MRNFKLSRFLFALAMLFTSPAFAQFSGGVSSVGIDNFATPVVGSILARQSAGWQALTCSSGQIPLFNGAGSPLTCFTPTGTGTVTSVAASVPAYMSVTGSPVTAAGTLAFSFASQTANTIFASPSGSAGVPTFRTVTALDLPATLTPTIVRPTGSSNLLVGAPTGGFLLFGSNGLSSLQLSGTNDLRPTIDNTLNIGQGTFRFTAGYFVSLGASGTPISSLYLTAPAATLFGNPTVASANSAQFTIQGLTDISAPSATLDWIPIYNAASGTIKKVNASELQTAVGGGVSSFNSRTGAVVPANGDYSSGQITTIISGTAPTAGQIGETISAMVTQVGAVTKTNGAAYNVTSVSLTAGSWSCSGTAGIVVGVGSTLNSFYASISSTSATTDTTNEIDVYVGGLPASGVGGAIAPSVYDVSTTTTIYLVGSYSHVTNSTASKAFGKLTCIRKA